MLLALDVYCQQGFINAYNFGYPNAVRFDAMVEEDNNLVICGYLRDSIAPYQQGVFFSKIDTLGQILTFKSYYDTMGYAYAPGSYPGGLAKLDDGTGFIFIGNLLQGPNGFIMKFDDEGNLLWNKLLDDPVALEGFYNRILETDSGLLILGKKQMTNNNGQCDIIIIKTDKEGNKLWEKTYGLSTRNDDATNLLKINDNEYVIGGYIRPNQGVPWQQWHHRIQIFAVDSLGNEKWYWESDPPFDEWSIEDSGCRGLHRTAEGNWVYATTRGEFQGGSTLWRQTKFVVRDSNFNLITERTYDDVDGQLNQLYNLMPLNDGDWLGVGVNRELVPPPSTIISHGYAWMNRISNGQDGQTILGDSLWMRLDLAFPDSLFAQGQHLHSVVELPSGSIIVAGYFDSFFFEHFRPRSPHQSQPTRLYRLGQLHAHQLS